MIEITNIEVVLENNPNNPRLLANVRIVLNDCFKVRGIRIIKGNLGKILVTMPDTKLQFRCGDCSKGNPCDSAYCRQCGKKLNTQIDKKDLRIFRNLAYPITKECRAYMDDVILRKYIEATSR